MAFVKRLTITRNDVSLPWDLFEDEESLREQYGCTRSDWQYPDDYTSYMDFSFETEENLNDWEVALDTHYDSLPDDPRNLPVGYSASVMIFES